MVCEEFHCLPSRALWEIANDPDGLVFRIIAARAYISAKRLVDSSKDYSALPKSALVQEALNRMIDLKEEAFNRRLAETQANAKG